MFKHRLQRKARLSRREAYRLVVTMARFTDNPLNSEQGFPVSSDEEVKGYFEAAGYVFDGVVEECRDPSISIPLVENVIGSTFLMIGDEKTEIIVTSNYEAAFDAAASHLDRAVTEASFSELESAIVRGIASIEGFLSFQAGNWNEEHPDNPLLDSKEDKVSFDTKIDDWIPILTGGAKLYKGDIHWQNFKKLRGIRDNLIVHPKSQRGTLTYLDLADLINSFRTGVAGFFIDLHVACRTFVPAHIIRAYYTPEVEVIRIDSSSES